MRILTVLLALAAGAIQWPLWFGHGGWLRVWELERQLGEREEANSRLLARNQALAAELASLRQGSEAIEERARGELHMMRPGETFFQFRSAPPGPAQIAAAAPAAASADPLQPPAE